jgi:vitamin B12 transporter
VLANCVRLPVILENRMKISRFALSVPLYLLSSSLHAELGPIVVTGTKTEVPQARSAVPVEVITSEQIRNSAASDAADLIQLYSNVDLARNGAYGKTTSIFIRGAESNHTLVLIDGVKMNPGTIGLAALQNISPDIIERIEIVKGPRSSLYGSDAIGGVINIITRKKIDGAQLNIVAGVGEDNTTKIGASALYGNETLSTGVTVEQYDTDGIQITDASEEDSGFDNQTINAFFDFQVGRSDFRFSYWEAQGNTEYYAFADLDQDFKNSVGSAVWDYALNGNISSHLRISTITDDIDQNQENFLAELDFADTDRDEIEWKLDYLTDSSLIYSLGILKSEESVHARSFGTRIDEDTDINAVYIMLQNQSENSSYAIVVRETDHEDFGNQTTWNIDYRYWVSASTNVYVGAGEAFRAPDATDRFGSIGNPDLDPERSETIEFGIEHRLSENDILSITYFENRIKDLIEPNATFTRVENIEKAKITGMELNLQGQRERWQYAVSLLAQDPENTELNQTLSRRAKSRINTQLTYNQDRWQAGGNLLKVGKRDNSSFDSIVLESYEIANVFARYDFTPTLNLSAKIENLFDKNYETAAGFNTKGRTAYVELAYSLVK